MRRFCRSWSDVRTRGGQCERRRPAAGRSRRSPAGRAVTNEKYERRLELDVELVRVVVGEEVERRRKHDQVRELRPPAKRSEAKSTKNRHRPRCRPRSPGAKKLHSCQSSNGSAKRERGVEADRSESEERLRHAQGHHGRVRSGGSGGGASPGSSWKRRRRRSRLRRRGGDSKIRPRNSSRCSTRVASSPWPEAAGPSPRIRVRGDRSRGARSGAGALVFRRDGGAPTRSRHRASSLFPEIESLNSRIPEPSERPISGRRLARRAAARARGGWRAPRG